MSRYGLPKYKLDWAPATTNGTLAQDYVVKLANSGGFMVNRKYCPQIHECPVLKKFLKSGAFVQSRESAGGNCRYTVVRMKDSTKLPKDLLKLYRIYLKYAEQCATIQP